jgi:hypothetical protein
MMGQQHFLDQAKNIVLNHLADQPFLVFLFGSRASNKHGSRADIDIGIWGTAPLPAHIWHGIRNDLDDSDIPLKIDLVDFYQCNEDFITTATKDIDLWQTPENFKKSSPPLNRLLAH